MNAPSPDIEAQILRSYHVEKWRVGTIAGQLHVHHSDAYLPFIRQTPR